MRRKQASAGMCPLLEIEWDCVLAKVALLLGEKLVAELLEAPIRAE
jgi:hypothetical protein